MPKSQLNAHRLGQVISVFVCLVWLCTLFSKQGHPVSCPGAWATSELYRTENGVSALKEGGLLLLGGGGRHSSSQTSGAKSRPPFSSALGGVVTAPRVREYIQATTCLTAGPPFLCGKPMVKSVCSPLSRAGRPVGKTPPGQGVASYRSSRTPARGKRPFLSLTQDG